VKWKQEPTQVHSQLNEVCLKDFPDIKQHFSLHFYKNAPRDAKRLLKRVTFSTASVLSSTQTDGSGLNDDHLKSSSGLWRSLVLWWNTYISKVHTASIFRVKCRWRQYGPPKRRYPTATLHGVTNQKTSTWNITVLEASNPLRPILDVAKHWLIPGLSRRDIIKIVQDVAHSKQC
jgi:hypothetical protein